MFSYKRLVIKISGESLKGDSGQIIDTSSISHLLSEIVKLHKDGNKISLVIGGGNILRGQENSQINRVTADHMGMLATVINGLAISDELVRKHSVSLAVMSSIAIDSICEKYSALKANEYLNNGRLLIFVAGTGNPFFSTDTAAVLKAIEMDSDYLLKATQVDGVYSDDPRNDPNAEYFSEITYDDVLLKKLKVMDATAIALARENSLPIIVFSLRSQYSFEEILSGKVRSTIIK